MTNREFNVSVRYVREHFATVKVVAERKDEADEKGLEMFGRDLWSKDGGDLGLPRRWTVHEPRDRDPEIDRIFRCIDCDKDTMGGEYYGVSDELWAAAGVAPNGGMLCLECLERRVGREFYRIELENSNPAVWSLDPPT